MSDVPDAPEQTQPLVTYSEFDLDLVAPATRFLTLTVDCGEDAEPRMQKRRFPLRGDLSIPEVGRLRRIEKTMEEAAVEDEQTTLLDVFEDLHDMITTLIKEKTPDAPELHITYAQAMPLLSWLSGDVSVADLIARTLTEGQSGALTAEEASAEQTDAPAEGNDAGSEPPFPLSERSETASSGSDASTDGAPAGGLKPVAPPPAFPGASSGRTSEKPALV